MIMDTNDYISKQPADRQNILTEINRIIVEEDKTVVSSIEPMMGKEMILYKAKGMMKYGLSSVKKYMSLHVLPIYGSTALHSKYKNLLTKASFQKGCINFENEDQVSLDILKQLIMDCSTMDLVKMREDYLKEKKLKH
jgi:hypothetical protein